MKKIEQKQLEPKVFKTTAVVWSNIAAEVASSGFLLWVSNSSIFIVLISVFVLLCAYYEFRHRNDCITLTQEGIGLDHVKIYDGSKKAVKCDHVDIEWRYVRRVEIGAEFRTSHIWVYAHNKLYHVDTSDYIFIGRQLKSWQKAIEEYGQVTCIFKPLS